MMQKKNIKYKDEEQYFWLGVFKDVVAHQSEAATIGVGI